jgi:hypothetical protein
VRGGIHQLAADSVPSVLDAQEEINAWNQQGGSASKREGRRNTLQIKYHVVRDGVPRKSRAGSLHIPNRVMLKPRQRNTRERERRRRKRHRHSGEKKASVLQKQVGRENRIASVELTRTHTHQCERKVRDKSTQGSAGPATR